MCNLESINYIHTLFVYEFQCDLNVVLPVRSWLIENTNPEAPIFGYAKKKCNSTSLPNQGKRLSHEVFETENDKNILNDYYNNLQTSVPPSPRIKRLLLANGSGVITIHLIGKLSTYELSMVRHNGLQYRYFERRTYDLNPQRVFNILITKEQFIEKLETLLQILTTTNTIPFAQFDVE